MAWGPSLSKWILRVGLVYAYLYTPHSFGAALCVASSGCRFDNWPVAARGQRVRPLSSGATQLASALNRRRAVERYAAPSAIPIFAQVHRRTGGAARRPCRAEFGERLGRLPTRARERSVSTTTRTSSSATSTPTAFCASSFPRTRRTTDSFAGIRVVSNGRVLRRIQRRISLSRLRPTSYGRLGAATRDSYDGGLGYCSSIASWRPMRFEQFSTGGIWDSFELVDNEYMPRSASGGIRARRAARRGRTARRTRSSSRTTTDTQTRTAATGGLPSSYGYGLLLRVHADWLRDDAVRPVLRVQSRLLPATASRSSTAEPATTPIARSATATTTQVSRSAIAVRYG